MNGVRWLAAILLRQRHAGEIAKILLPHIIFLFKLSKPIPPALKLDADLDVGVDCMFPTSCMRLADRCRHYSGSTPEAPVCHTQVMEE